MMKKCLPFLLLWISLFACQQGNKQDHPYTFYYWKSTLALTDVEKDALQQSTEDNFYVRLLDIDKINNRFEPIANVIKKESFETNKHIIPVVFITNRTFLNIQPQEIEFLVENLSRVIKDKMARYNFNAITEIQIDCDWTAGTKDDYFKFLEQLKEVSGKTITTTLRLHQVKYKEKTGIPPVDKVYLMCYSTSSPLENSDKNSILDQGILENYLAAIGQYPIQNMTIALPIYSWGIIENHLGKHKLINGLNAKDLDNPNFKKLNKHNAAVLKDGFYFGYYLNKGFKIKVEEISTSDLQKAISFLEKKIESFPIVYYQLDEQFVSDRNFKY